MVLKTRAPKKRKVYDTTGHRRIYVVADYSEPKTHWALVDKDRNVYARGRVGRNNPERAVDRLIKSGEFESR